ncbi:MAG: hypothetical protein M3T49_06220 [Candidatus Eremiobacteraeota bacterium]|nr:hypothetical protein [Candidatus Eremiobacteraeota bacterium]
MRERADGRLGFSRDDRAYSAGDDTAGDQPHCCHPGCVSQRKACGSGGRTDQT